MARMELDWWGMVVGCLIFESENRVPEEKQLSTVSMRIHSLYRNLALWMIM